MIKRTEWWENQEGFDPDALRQAFQEQLEMWAEEYRLEKDPDEELIEDDSVVDDIRRKEGNWWLKAFFSTDGEYYDLSLRVSWDVIVELYYEIPYASQKKLAYFSHLKAESGDIGLQRALELRAQIEKRINEIELEQLGVD